MPVHSDRRIGAKMEAEFINVSGKGKKSWLKEISFPVKNGFITGLVGKNGAGKTTLFRTIMEERADYTGEILIDGKPLQENRKAVLNRIGFVSEEQQFFMEKSAMENAKLFAPLYDRFDIEIFTRAMKRMELQTGKILGKMSRGQFLKFQLAFAQAHDSRLYLLDEVTAGMDPVFKKDFFRFLHEQIAQEDMAVLMSTHIEEEVNQHMDYEAIMEEGHLVSFKEAGNCKN